MFIPNITASFDGCFIYLGETAYHINNHGFRGKDFQIEKKSAYRIISLGDSFTFGWGLNDDETFSTRLEKELNEICTDSFEVINLGIPAYQAEDEVRIMKTLGLNLSPDIVLITFVGDDWHSKEMALIHDSYLENITDAYMAQAGKDELSPAEQMKLYMDAQHFMRTNLTDLTFDQVKTNYFELRQLGRQQNITILAGYFPTEKAWKDRLIGLYTDLNWTAFDFTDLYAKRYLLNIEDAHPNKEANSIMAKRFGKEIMLRYCQRQ